MFPYNTNTNYYFNFYNRRSWCPRGYPPYNNRPYNNPRYNNPQVDNSYNQQSEVHSPNYWNFNYTRSPNNTDGYYNNFNPQFYCNRGQINSNNNFRRGGYNTNRQIIRSTSRQVIISKNSSTISLPIINADTKVLENPEPNIENSTNCNKIENCTENFENFEKNNSNEDVVDNCREENMEIDSDADTVVLDNYSNLESTSSLDGNTAVKEKNSDSDKIDLQLRNELNIEGVNKQPNSVRFNREAFIRKILNIDSLKKPTRRKSIAGREFCEIRIAKRKIRSASIPSDHDLLLSQIGPSSIITRSKSRQEVPPSPTKIIISTKKKQSKKKINQDVSSVQLHDKHIKMNSEMNVKSATIEKDNQQPMVDKSELKRSNSAQHSSKSKKQDLKLILGSSSKDEFSVSETNKIQAKRKRLEAIFGEDDFNSLPTEKTETVTSPNFTKVDLKKSSKKLLGTPTTSESDSNTPSYYKIKTQTNKKILTICKPNRENTKVNLKSLYTPGVYDIDNAQEENDKMNHNEKHSKKRKHESKSVKKLESSEKRSKSTDDKFVAKNKLEKSDHKRKKEKRSSKKQISNHSNEKEAKLKTNKIEEFKEVLISIPETNKIEEFKEVLISIPETNSTDEPILHYQIISPPHVTESYEEQICTIDLDDYSDDDIHENPMGLLIKSERPLEDVHIDRELSPDLTQDSDIYEVLRESNSVNETTENEATILQTNVEEVPCLSDRDYDEEYFISDALEVNESIAEEIIQHSTIFHTSVEEFPEVKYISPEPKEDVKPIIPKESVILIEDKDDAIKELLKIDYSDFAAIFVDDFRYYHYVENSVYQFSIHSNSSTTVDNQNKYSELFESRKLIFDRISKAMYNYLKKHEILNFDCHKLIDEINKTSMTNWNTTISSGKILRFLHDIILTWRRPDNDFIKMFCNNISYSMLLSNDENCNANSQRPNSVISSTSEAVVSNSVSTTQTVAAAQTTSEENQQIEQNLKAAQSLISPRPIEQLLANPSISRHQSPLLSPSESQSSNDVENISKQSDPSSENPKTLYSSTQPHHTTNQSASNQLSLPQSASRSGALVPPSYEDYQERIKALSQSPTVPPVHWTSVTPPTSQSQSPTVKRHYNKPRTSKLPNQPSQNLQNLLQTPPYRMPSNNVNIIDNLAYSSPISHLTNMSQNHFQPPNAMSVQQFTQNMTANTGNYPRYASQHSQNQSLTSTQPAQSTLTGNLHTYHHYPRYPGVYHEQSENQAHQQQSQYRGPQTAATTLTKNLANNLHFHGYHLENGTQLQQPAQLQQQPAQMQQQPAQMQQQPAQMQQQPAQMQQQPVQLQQQPVQLQQQPAQSRLQQMSHSRLERTIQLQQQQQAAQLEKQRQQAAQLQQQRQQAPQLHQQRQQATQLHQQQAAQLHQQQATPLHQQQATPLHQQQTTQLHQQQAAHLHKQQAAQLKQQQAAQLQQQQAAQLQQQQQAAQLQQQQQAAQLQQQQAAQLQQQQAAQLQLQQTARLQHPNVPSKQLLKYPYEQQHQLPTEHSQQRVQSQPSNLSSEIRSRSTGVYECTSTSKTPDMECNVLDSGTCTNNLVPCNIPTNATGNRSCTPLNHLVQNNVSVSGSRTNMSPNDLVQSSVSTSGVKSYVSSNNVVHNNVSGSGIRTCTPTNNLVQSNVSAIEGETCTTVKIEVPKIVDDIIECIIIEDDDSTGSSDDQNLSSPTISSSLLTSTTTKTEDVSFFQDNQTCICSNKATHVCACKKAVYCSEDCQAEDWEKHKLICM